MRTKELTAAVKAAKAGKSAWAQGVKAYAVEMVEGLEVQDVEVSGLEAVLLNGAKDWQQYSEGGSSLVWEGDIAARLCSPSELRRFTRKDGSLRRPNASEDWIAVQARALRQASGLVKSCAE